MQDPGGFFPFKGPIVAGTSPQLELRTFVSSLYSLLSVSPSDQGKRLNVGRMSFYLDKSLLIAVLPWVLLQDGRPDNKV